MRVGVPREVKNHEYRVALTPAGVTELLRSGHEVVIEHDAGAGSLIPDADFVAAGAQILPSADDVWAAADLVLKVKEPVAEEYHRMRSGQTLFTYLHLAASAECTKALLSSGIDAVAYETVQLPDLSLPLLAPMSEVAGRMAPQCGAHSLERAQGGRGVLLGGVSGVYAATVVVIGAGVAGMNAAAIALGMQAEVILLDRNVEKLRTADRMYQGHLQSVTSNSYELERAVLGADLVIGAVLVAGGRAPMVVTDAMVRGMKRGAVIVDVAVDQGGCVETTHETTHSVPVYEVHGVLHYAVGNIPGSVPHTSTYALTNATLPYVLAVAEGGVGPAVARDLALRAGVNTVGGRVTNPAVAEALGVEAVDPVAELAG